MRFSGKIAMITGGGTGIGRCTALAFAAEGARVVIVGRRPEPLRDTVEALQARGGVAHAVEADLTDPDAVRRAVDQTLAAAGRIDVLVNNAGEPGQRGHLHETDLSTWRIVIEANLTSCFLAMRAVLGHFVEHGAGVIVNVASINGLRAAAYNAAYGAAKAGVIALTRSVAVEYGRNGIRCNCICPGTVETAMTEEHLAHPARRARIVASIPLGRIGTADDIARAILYLASDSASFITGAVLSLDGGATAG